jgi:hypothetical protein
MKTAAPTVDEVRRAFALLKWDQAEVVDVRWAHKTISAARRSAHWTAAQLAHVDDGITAVTTPYRAPDLKDGELGVDMPRLGAGLRFGGKGKPTRGSR